MNLRVLFMCFTYRRREMNVLTYIGVAAKGAGQIHEKNGRYKNCTSPLRDVSGDVSPRRYIARYMGTQYLMN